MEKDVLIICILVFLGLVLGSFAGATVWRLRAKQLRSDAKHGEKVPASDKKQVAQLKKTTLTKDRSVCLHCGHALQWYDLLPLVSWLSLGGKCRYCHKQIGNLEPLIEIGLAVFFVVSYVWWPLPLDTLPDIARFSVWLLAGFGMAILFAYDAKWFLLPNSIVFPLIALGAVNALLIIFSSSQPVLLAVLDVLLSCATLSGLYYVIYVLSKHQWVGFGDVKLGLALGLLLGSWQLAILALFLANLIGTIVLAPQLLSGKVKRHSHVPFGPLLILGWAISGVFGIAIQQWYLGIML